MVKYFKNSKKILSLICLFSMMLSFLPGMFVCRAQVPTYANISIFGMERSGKTQLINRFANGNFFDGNYRHTARGNSCQRKFKFSCNNEGFDFFVNFRESSDYGRHSYCDDGDICVVTFDLSEDNESYTNTFEKFVKPLADRNQIFIVVGTKMNSRNSNVDANKVKLKSLAEEKNLKLFFTDAESDMCVRVEDGKVASIRGIVYDIVTGYICKEAGCSKESCTIDDMDEKDIFEDASRILSPISTSESDSGEKSSSDAKGAKKFQILNFLTKKFLALSGMTIALIYATVRYFSGKFSNHKSDNKENKKEIREEKENKKLKLASE